MKPSLSLGLYLLLAGGGSAPAVRRPDRPVGPLIWLHAATPDQADALTHIARRIARAGGPAQLLVTFGFPFDSNHLDLPPTTLTDAPPADRRGAVQGFLAHWKPDAALVAGTRFPPALVTEIHAAGVPLYGLYSGASAHLPYEPWKRSLLRAVVTRFTEILVPDDATAARLSALAGPGPQIEASGPVEDVADPLPATEAEREALATLLRARPVWLAMSVPEDELADVIAAHAQAMRHAHRMLLICVPRDPDATDRIGAAFAAEGWEVAHRARDEEPLAEVQVMISDGETELGLWYRLAPVTFMGGTLGKSGSGRSPMEPAALGSAVICGPTPGPHAAAYGRLAAARASRLVRDTAALAAAVADLIAPDRAAQLAHNAWTASSGGAEVADRLARSLVAAATAPGADARAGRSTSGGGR
jgi:3-deoxy-D-manno-octulosonic-acid transferase